MRIPRIILQILESDWVENEDSIRESSIKEVFENYSYEMTMNIDDIKDYFNHVVLPSNNRTKARTTGYLPPTQNYNSSKVKDEYFDF